MDIVFDDPNTTAVQLVQRAGFNALMERPGTTGTMGPATFFTTANFSHHLTAHAAARGIWALWKGGVDNNPALDAAVDLYKQTWLDFITEDGVYREDYALS